MSTERAAGLTTLDEGNNPAEGRLRRNLARLASGSIVAQAVVAASTPILTRLFTPEAFGVAALFSAAYGLSIPLVTLKYDQAVVIPKANAPAKSIGAMAMAVATVNSLIVGLGVFIYLYILPGKREPSWLLLPVALWIGSAYTLMQQWSSRAANYTHYARGQVIGAVVNVSISIGAALVFSGHPVFIVLGFTAGMGISLAYTIWGFKNWPFALHGIHPRGITRRVYAYGNFPMLVLPTALITVVGYNGVPFVLAPHYTLNEVGVFAVANRFLVIPAAIVGGALSEAVRSEFAASQRAGEPVTPVFRKSFRSITVVAGVLFGGVYLVAPETLRIVFGAEYAGSGTTAQALIPAVFSQFVCAPFVYVFAILRKPAIGLLAQIALSLAPVGALIVFSRQAVLLNTALLLYSYCTLVGGAIMLVLVFRGCKSFDAGR